jgi:acetyltransferase-like isoleucine patch superfamily enzyme
MITIGDFVFVGSNAVVGGYGVIGDGVYIAPSATVRDELHIGRFAVIGLGSVVTNDIPESAVAAGVPARPIGAAFGD